MGSIQGAPTVPPRAPPATPVDGTGTVSHASDLFVPKPARYASGCLVAWLACGSVSGVVRQCPQPLLVIVTQLVTYPRLAEVPDRPIADLRRRESFVSRRERRQGPGPGVRSTLAAAVAQGPSSRDVLVRPGSAGHHVVQRSIAHHFEGHETVL